MTVLGYAEVNADQTGISAEADLTGLSVTVNVAAGRYVRITGRGAITQADASGTAIGHIKESTTYLSRWIHEGGAAGETHSNEGWAILTPSGGSHTYKLSLETSGGTVDLVAATAGQEAYILVEDIGPV